MRKSKILSILLALLIGISVFSGLFGCNCAGKEPFTVTFVGGEGAVLVSGDLVQEVTEASQIQPPVFQRPGYAFDSWSHILEDISEDTTVEALWYSGYKVVLNRRYYDSTRNKNITIGYDSRRGDTVKIPYNTRLGAMDTLFPIPIIADDDYEFSYWEIVLDDGLSYALAEETIFNDDLFVAFGVSVDEVFNERGKTFTVNPILKFVGHYAPLN